MTKEICGECMVVDDHDAVHYTDDEWHDRLGHCTGCNPNTSSYGQSDEDEEVQVETKNLAPVFTQLNTRTTGYHFGPLSFQPGKNGVRDVLVGDPGIPGVVSIKVIYKGTGKRPSIFTVPIALVIIEEEELPIEIVGSLKGQKLD
jgi:hypothetical protein